MSHDRQLIDTIKGHFAERSTSHLEEIKRLKDLERWSEEALVAADEVLADRAAGRAKEPRVPVKDDPPLSSKDHFNELLPILGFAMGGLVGGVITKFAVGPEDQPLDQPVSFGSDNAWLAVETRDTAKAAAALGLKGLRQARWEEGIKASSGSKVFVTPPLGDWTLAVSTALFPPEEIATFVKPLLEPLSRQFRDAQYFCTHKTMALHVWARAQKGRCLRGYGWLGQQNRVLWDEGTQTKEERRLGLRRLDSSTAPAKDASSDDLTTADESCVLQLASLWSVDPSTLDEHFQEPVLGLLGDIRRS